MVRNIISTFKNRLVRRSVLLMSLAVLAALLVSFSQFVSTVGIVPSPHKLSKADGVVVLTGAENRIQAGLQLLKDKQANRLLISGVGEKTSRADLAKTLDEPLLLEGCCVDIDRDALDTRGNAVYTARWAELNGFKKLLVVTSDYHMPRALFLLKRRMPDIELIAAPTKTEHVNGRSLVGLVFSPVMISEYMKYVAARFGVEPSAKILLSAVWTTTRS